ncbi:MFS transporter [Tomitella fengzijianii]|uniref:MFS transporter n=1 Tax=Tomitella fengzijianii TaxID=2597660 RepID=A0A516X0W5_9ACTN|nr:MFS transporter [Tomitella fengzijianii]QDQ96703.1 MFS transporter [Tomitella fengzijianii]
MGSPPASSTPGRHDHAGARPRTGFAVVGLLFFATMGYGTVTTPLWPLYQDRDHFGPTMVTVVFSMYAVGTVATLMFAGSLSDRFGRTRILAAAAALGIASVLVFLLWQSVPGLLTARLVQGMGVGLTTSTATAAMVELGHRGAVRRPATSATTATTLANLGGLGAGALIGGMISEWVPGPLTAPFIFFGAAIAVAGLALTLVPETAPRGQGPAPATPHRRAGALIAVPRGKAGVYFCSGALGLTAFAVFGTFTALVPVILADVLESPGRVLSGVLVMLVMGTAAGAQLLLRNARTRTLASAGVALYPVGWLLTALAVHASSLALFIVSSVVAGTAAGLLFKTGSSTVDRIADPQRRAGAHSGFFLISYIGMALPVIGLAALGGVIGTVWSVVIFGLVLAAAAGAGMAGAVPRMRGR